MKTKAMLCAAVGALLMVSAAASAAKPKKLSTSAQMNKLIGRVCNVELGNGAYAFRSYNPASYSRKANVKLIRADMKNFESRGVRFRTSTGVTQVKAALQKQLTYPESNVKTLSRAIDGFKKLGVLQDVVYRGLSGGNAVGYSYFSVPHQVFFNLKTPTGKGKRLEVFMELGD